ncbi:PP0621 family protein [Undibacterium sp.]|uniref:PP0621 family protein n=1 Tax=Undibacterium sp. TaxID=1914977 RepID=UPI0025EA8395|nr:PP0621 family protein [Undibacterium sp.]MCX7218060.1 PP0621 family protein [Burkholderiales bacterium]
MRFLMWLALGVLVLFAVRKKAQNLARPNQPSQASAASQAEAGAAATSTGSAESMVCCERCQLYFPASEAVFKENKSYCCAAHAEQS